MPTPDTPVHVTDATYGAATSPTLQDAMPPALLPRGWSLWASAVVDDSPYCYRTVEIWRHEWVAPRCVNPWSLPPQMNVVDLYWRPLRDDD